MFSLEDCWVNLGKYVFKIPLHLAYVATRSCETLLSAKQAINVIVSCTFFVF